MARLVRELPNGGAALLQATPTIALFRGTGHGVVVVAIFVAIKGSTRNNRVGKLLQVLFPIGSQNQGTAATDKQ